MCLSKLRCLSKVTSSSLTKSTSETVPAKSIEVRWESDWSRGLVPKQIASVLVGYRMQTSVDEPAGKRGDTPLEAAETAR